MVGASQFHLVNGSMFFAPLGEFDEAVLLGYNSGGSNEWVSCKRVNISRNWVRIPETWRNRTFGPR